MTKLKQLMIFLRATFWFIPLIIVFLSIILASVLIEVDSSSSYNWANEWPRLFGAGAEGSRGMLSTIAGSIMTMIGVTFSMTLVTLTLASSQYTSRILRNFIRDRRTQTSLGIFAGIFTYCLIVLRAIRGEEVVFVPSLSIFVGFVMALLGVGVLVFFIHHVAASIQASYIISSIAEETILSMKNLYPDEMNEMADEAEFESDDHDWTQVTSAKSGYVQTLGEQGLMELAKKIERRIKINFAPGDFVVFGAPLAYIENFKEISHEQAEKVRGLFSLQRYRTIEQDALFGIRQIVDTGLKALSPGVNDTTTAVICVDYLTSTLSYLIKRKFPSRIQMTSNGVSVFFKRPSFHDFLLESYSQIRVAASGNKAILKKIMHSLGALYALCPIESRNKCLLEQADKVLEEISHTFDIPSERKELLEELNHYKNVIFLKSF